MTNSYDDVPYPSHPYQVTHPDHIYTMATLFKMDPVLPEESRVLEIGCASGGNIIPLALQMPSAEFVGIDLSQEQIKEGQDRVRELGLTNIKLETLDLNLLGDEHGKFDYITCHGVFSWVPPEIQKRIFEVCSERLTPRGLAYVSYNAYPGWFMRGMIRQMMLRHVSNIEDSKVKVQQARALLQFLVESTEGQTTPYASFLREELGMLSKHSDAYLFHDHLENENHPMFFADFVELADSTGLQFVGETNLSSMVTDNLPKKAAETLAKLTKNLHHRSQYTDFVTNRMFRQSLLCKKGAKVDRHLSINSLEGLFLSGSFAESDGNPEGSETPQVTTKGIAFKCANGRILRTPNIVLQTMFRIMSASFPKSRTAADIVSQVQEQLSEVSESSYEPANVESICLNYLLQMIVRGDIEFRALPDRFVTELSEMPCVSDLNRLQAQASEPLTTQKHSMLNADGFSKMLIPLLDGKHSREELASHIGELVDSGVLTINSNGATVDRKKVHDASVNKVLDIASRSALLIH
ncbi:MAG: methyltransferase regulatory domain-containing protein [Aureliella sp.]